VVRAPDPPLGAALAGGEELVPSVTADVVEGAELTVIAAHQQEAVIADGIADCAPGASRPRSAARPIHIHDPSNRCRCSHANTSGEA